MVEKVKKGHETQRMVGKVKRRQVKYIDRGWSK